MVHRDGQDRREAVSFVAELPRATAAGAAVRMALLVDRSHSMGESQPRANALAEQILAALDPRARIQLIPFDLLPRGVEGPVNATGEAVARLRARVRGLTPAGGSAFVPAFERALRAGADHIVLVTDGGSPQHQAELEHLLRTIHDRRGTTVSVLVLGRNATVDALNDMARLTGGLYRAVGAKQQLSDLARAVARLPARPGVTATTGGGAACAAHVLRIEPFRVLVAGRIEGGQARRIELGLTDGSAATLALADGGRARAAAALWAGAEIARLEQRVRLFGDEAIHRPTIVELSRRYRVASEYTAFLVTETDADYARPTSGRKWQRQVRKMGEDTPSFHSTPEPHEWALIGLCLLMLWVARRRGWLPKPRRHAS